MDMFYNINLCILFCVNPLASYIIIEKPLQTRGVVYLLD